MTEQNQPAGKKAWMLIIGAMVFIGLANVVAGYYVLKQSEGTSAKAPTRVELERR